jgi:2-polyprenyl-3-methyl-5-hydroxy-6-metoxy-1,4-benzoquinol methylase
MNAAEFTRKLKRAPSFAYYELKGRLRRPLLRHFRRALVRHLYPARKHRMYKVWWNFTITGLDRGEAAVRLLRKYRPIAGARYLDVGTACGGFPIAFARAGAAAAIGFERDRPLRELAQEQLKDRPCSARIIPGDALDEQFMRSLGTFDIITCNDVIEHVDDAWLLVRHLALCLRPGGILYMEMPNGWSYGQIMKDSHYGLFGISLLRQPEAIAYFRQKFDRPYEVGEYYTMDQYVEAFRREKVHLECLDTPVSTQGAVKDLLAKMRSLENSYEERVSAAGVDHLTQQRLRDAVRAHLAEFRASLKGFEQANGSGYDAAAARALILKYETEFWRFLGKKEA